MDKAHALCHESGNAVLHAISCSPFEGAGLVQSARRTAAVHGASRAGAEPLAHATPVPSRQAARACQGPSPSTPRAPSRPPGRPGFGATAALRERGATHPAQPPVPHTAERRQGACAPRPPRSKRTGPASRRGAPKVYTPTRTPTAHSRTRRARAARPPTAPPAPKTHAAAPAADAVGSR